MIVNLHVQYLMKTFHALEEYDVIYTVVGPPFVSYLNSLEVVFPWEFDICDLLSYFLITWKQRMDKIWTRLYFL